MTNEKIPQDRSGGWKELLTRPDQSRTLILGVFFFASCLVLPLANDTRIATVFMVACVLLYYSLNQSLRALLHYAWPVLPLILLSEMIPGVPNLMTLPCVYVALLVGGATGGFLLTHFHDPKGIGILLLLPAAAFGAVALLTHNPMRALLVLLPAVLAAAAGLCLLKCVACKDAVITLAAVLVCSAAVAGLITLAFRGELHTGLLTALADKIRAHIHASVADTVALYAEAGITLTVPELEINNLASSLINIAPGLFLALCGVCGFLLWHSLLNMLMSLGSLPRLPRHIAGFGISRTGAAVFLAATVLSLFASGTDSVFGAICENLCLAMSPGLALIGCSLLFAKGRQRSCLSTLIAAGLILLLFVDIFSALTLAAVFGAVTVLTSSLLPGDNDNQKGEQ